MSLKDVTHPPAMLAGLNRLRHDNELCDVVLKIRNTAIPAHKVVLSAGSCYFSAMFNGNFPESSEKEIEIHGIDRNSFAMLVDFIYTGHLAIDHDNVQDLLIAAGFLQIQWVIEKCCEYLEGLIDGSNCLSIRNFADKHSCKMLCDAATKYIIQNFEDVCRSGDFVALERTEVENILRNESLYDHNEDLILNAILKWVNAVPSDRTSCLPFLLEYINPLLVSQSVINDSDIITTQPECALWRLKASGKISTFDWNVFILDKTGKAQNFSIYNLKTQNYIGLPSLPERPFGASLCGENCFLYAQGGAFDRKSSKNCFRFNIFRHRWTPFKSLRVPRSHHCSRILNGSIYTIGGTGLEGATDSVERLDLASGQQEIVAEMQEERSSMGAVAYENCLYVMGGENETECLYSLERFDPRESAWHKLASMGEVNSYCSSAIMNNSIYCAKGLGSFMERYDIRTNSWDLIAFNDDREFYELMAVENDLYGLSGEGLFKFNGLNNWSIVFDFPGVHEWDTAVPINVENVYS